MQGNSVQKILTVQKLEMPSYLTLYSPALDWIMQCLAYKGSEDILMTVLEKVKTTVNR